MRIILEDESCDILENASLLLERINEDYIDSSSKVKVDDNKQQQQEEKIITNNNTKNTSSVNVVRYNTQAAAVSNGPKVNDKKTRSVSVAGVINTNMNSSQQQNAVNLAPPSNALIEEVTNNNNNSQFKHSSRHMSIQSSISPVDGARAICDEVIRDSIGSCREVDYKMELAKLLSPEAKIELYIELGKLSNAQRLACTMNRADYVSSIIEEAAKLNQNHVKTVCQLWLAKHETGNILR